MGLVARFPTCILHHIGITVHLCLRYGEQHHTTAVDAMLLNDALIEVHILVSIGQTRVHDVETVEVATLATFVVSGINPSVGHLLATAPCAIGHIPATYIEVMLVFIGQLDESLAVNYLQHKLLRKRTKVDTWLSPYILFGLIGSQRTLILGHTGTLADKVHVVNGLTKVAQLGTCLGIVEVHLGQTEHHAHIPVALLTVIELTADGAKDRIVVG